MRVIFEQCSSVHGDEIDGCCVHAAVMVVFVAIAVQESLGF